MDRARLIAAAAVLAEHEGTDEAAVAALMTRGFSAGEAWRLAAFVPSAFSRPILEEFGVAAFPDHVLVPTEDGGEVRAFLADQPEYVAALALARDHRAAGSAMPQEHYAAIAGGAAEIDALSNALDAGVDVTGAAVATALVGAGRAKHVVLRRTG
jgi:hypothetical protein